ncbi:MAG: pyridoxal-phosphate dependent enzyme [Planctomycetales bacterium]|nr:pyridoxal-phosphate dependent enzyme [Planctomycetales bacterium]
MSIWRFSDQLPTIARQHQITLGEGTTPLVRSTRIGPSLGVDHLYLKIESANPTGSYKDRYAACAVSRLRADDAHVCLGTSSGNAGAALAAYSAVAGLRCILAIVESAPQGKLRQMLAYGAELVPIRGFGTNAEVTQQVMLDLERLAARLHTRIQISAFKYCPEGMQGVGTISLELCEQLPEGIDHVLSPTAGGGLTLAVARGFESTATRPAVHCVQPRGNNTIAGPLREGATVARACQCTTSISGLQVANVIDGHETLAACRASGGTGFLVEDEQVFEMQQRLAREEGVFCEPAGAVAIAGAAEAIRNGEISQESRIVCLVTGSAFKDSKSLEQMSSAGLHPMVDSVAEFSDLL